MSAKARDETSVFLRFALAPTPPPLFGQDYAPNYDATPCAACLVKSITSSADHVLARIRGLGEIMVGIRRTIADGELSGPSLSWWRRVAQGDGTCA